MSPPDTGSQVSLDVRQQWETIAVSYDIMVFDPELAPSDPASFLQWYEDQTEWDEPHSYDDPKVSTEHLRAWFLEMIKSYPALNGPYVQPGDPPNETDYSVGSTIIYACFSWQGSAEFHRTAFETAQKHKLGFFEAGAEPSLVWLPTSSGELEIAHSH